MRWSDRILILASLALLVMAPVMALQELALVEEIRAGQALTGQTQPVDLSFRDSWRVALFVIVLVAGVLGSWMSLRVARLPRVRAVSGRLVGLLLAGLALLDVAFYLDGRFFVGAPLGVRASTIVWVYPVAAVLVVGAALRLSEVEEAFAREPASLLEPSAA